MKPSSTNTIDPSTEFSKVEKMLYNIAWKFARKYPFPNEEEMFEECKSEAYFSFMRACDKYTPGRSKFITYCHYRVDMDLRTFVTKRTKDPLCFVEIDEELCGAVPMIKSEVSNLVLDLKGDAKELLSLLLEIPQDVMPTETAKRIRFGFGNIETLATKYNLLERVKNYMMENRGWSHAAVENAHDELIWGWYRNRA